MTPPYSGKIGSIPKFSIRCDTFVFLHLLK